MLEGGDGVALSELSCLADLSAGLEDDEVPQCRHYPAVLHALTEAGEQLGDGGPHLQPPRPHQQGEQVGTGLAGDTVLGAQLGPDQLESILVRARHDPGVEAGDSLQLEGAAALTAEAPLDFLHPVHCNCCEVVERS